MPPRRNSTLKAADRSVRSTLWVLEEKAIKISLNGLYLCRQLAACARRLSRAPQSWAERSGVEEALSHTLPRAAGPQRARFWRDGVGVPSALRGLT